MIVLQLENTTYHVEENTSVQDLVKMHPNQKVIYGCILNGKIHDLSYRLQAGGNFSFIEAGTPLGEYMYLRSLLFLFIVSVKQTYKDVHIHLQHSFSNGLYCEVEGMENGEEHLLSIQNKMKENIRNKVPFERIVVSKQEAIAHFEALEKEDTAGLLRYRKGTLNSIYRCLGRDDYFYEVLLPNASYIQDFALRFYQNGFHMGRKDNPFIKQDKLIKAFSRAKKSAQEQGISCVAQLNGKVKAGKVQEVIIQSENAIEKQFHLVAKKIVGMEKEVKVILIAGPSSAGKTSFSRRLAAHLQQCKKETIAISMDDYYKNRVDSPLLEDGSYDYENITCVDLDLFHEQVTSLIKKEEVHLSKYNFLSGEREWDTKTTKVEDNTLLIIEGIHGLNPLTSASLPQDALFKVYINDLNILNLDNHNRIPTSDYRLLRRIVRDHKFRGYSATETIASWPKVKAGEEMYIYPYQEEADFVFNTSVVYELSLLKRIAMPLLDEVKLHQKECIEANRLKKILYYFIGIDSNEVPKDSILREFIGGSVFFE